jgi:hypothetical protein
MKVPRIFDAVHFCNVVGLKPIGTHPPSVGFEFGTNQLWIDRAASLSQTEIWLELVTNNVPEAAKHLNAAGVVRCDAIERLPEGFQAFWISSPASIIHLVCKDKESW